MKFKIGQFVRIKGFHIEGPVVDKRAGIAGDWSDVTAEIVQILDDDGRVLYNLKGIGGHGEDESLYWFEEDMLEAFGQSARAGK
jgi:hypothetical protein